MGKPIRFHERRCRPLLRVCSPSCTTFHVGPVARLSNKYQLLEAVNHRCCCCC